jgi:DHA1 family inner membrane transport protein
VKRSLTISLIVLGLSVVGFALTASTVPGLLVFIFLLGGSVGACSPAIQTRLMDVAHDAQSFAAALNHSALNIGNSLGAFLGGLVIAAGFGYLSPAVVGALLSVVGLVLLLTSFAVERSRRLASR